MIYVLGGAGFVGSAFARYCERQGLAHQVITRINYERFRGTSCDILIDASGNSKKYLSDRDPLTDFDHSVRQVYTSLEGFRAGCYVLISSGDVYHDTSSPEQTRETAPLDIRRISRYGQHKLVAETLVLARHPDWLIIRAGGFVGPRLSKNAVFDILTGSKIWLSPSSMLQFIHTDAAAEIVMSLAMRGVRKECVNLGGRGLLRLGSLHRELGSSAVFDPDAPTVRYELSLNKLESLISKPLPYSEETVRRFAAEWPNAT